jgi:PEP-CTERM motif-containing protein
MKIRKILVAAAALCAALSPGVQAQSLPNATQTWNFQDAIFHDWPGASGQPEAGGSLSGFFVVDALTHMILSWDIVTSPGSAGCVSNGSLTPCRVTGYTYTNATSHLAPWVSGRLGGSETDLYLLSGLDPLAQTSSPFLGLSLTPTADPARLSLTMGNSGEDWFPGSRAFSTGFAVLAVPEPATYLLMLGGLAALGLLVRRR